MNRRHFLATIVSAAAAVAARRPKPEPLSFEHRMSMWHEAVCKMDMDLRNRAIEGVGESYSVCTEVEYGSVKGVGNQIVMGQLGPNGWRFKNIEPRLFYRDNA